MLICSQIIPQPLHGSQIISPGLSNHFLGSQINPWALKSPGLSNHSSGSHINPRPVKSILGFPNPPHAIHISSQIIPRPSSHFPGLSNQPSGSQIYPRALKSFPVLPNHPPDSQISPWAFKSISRLPNPSQAIHTGFQIITQALKSIWPSNQSPGSQITARAFKSFPLLSSHTHVSQINPRAPKSAACCPY